jgi:hypothetical protein
MPVPRLVIVSSIALLLSVSGADAGEQPRLWYRIGDLFPAEIEASLPKDLIGGGCMTQHLYGVTVNGCPVLRGESSWVNFEISWDGARPVTLKRTRGDLLNAGMRKGPPWSGAAPPMTWQPTPGVTLTSRGFVLEPRSRMIVRIDLSELAATAPAGNYEICFAPALVPGGHVRWARESDGCHRFWLRDLTDIRLRLEYLRRQSIDLLSAGRCDEATGLVDEMLAVYPVSAVAYRLRATIAELQRRVADAAADTLQASELLTSGADRLLIFDEQQRQAMGDALKEWGTSFEFADPVNGFLGPPVDGAPQCRR